MFFHSLYYLLIHPINKLQTINAKINYIKSESIVLSITNSKGKLFSTETTNTNSIGNWMIPITIPFDAPIDTYTAEIINGENIISKSWDVVLSKKIHISPSKQKFQPDETMTFIGSGNPGSDVIVKIVNPNGIEVSSGIYFIKLKSGDQESSKKIMLLK